MAEDITEEEKVRRVLQELSRRSADSRIQGDVKTLEKLLGDPVFRRFSQESSKSSERLAIAKTQKRDLSVEAVRISQRRFRDIRIELEPTLIRFITSDQVLLFVSLSVEISKSLIVKNSAKSDRLLVIGPEDINDKSTGRIQITDQILAIDHKLLFSVPTVPLSRVRSSKSIQSFNSKRSEIVTSASEKKKKKAALTGDTKEPRISSKQNIAPCSTAFDTHQANIEPFNANVCSRKLQFFSPIEIFNNYLAEVNREQVTLALIRDSSQMVLIGEWTQVQLIRLVNEPGIGLGFGIVGGTSTGVVVKTILPGSVADKDRRLRPGDHILKIGSVHVHGMSSQQVATILRQQEAAIDLVVGRTLCNADKAGLDNSNCWTMPTRVALCPEGLEEQIRRQLSCLQRANEHSNELQQQENHESTEAVVNELVDQKSPTELQASYVPKSNGGLRVEDNQPVETCLSGNASITATNVPSRAALSQKTSDDGSLKAKKAEKDRSLRHLQEQTLTVFGQDKWIPGKYEVVEVELCRDPVLGLGITVAGYVHRKEEINGVFVKSLVPQSNAYYSKKIQLHDLIAEVNGQSLEKLSHTDSVRTLVKSGSRVRLKLIRFLPGSPQADCLKMLQEQETATQVIDIQSNLRDVVADWRKKLGAEFEVISVDLIPDKSEDGGLGISLEGTVDVVDGTHLCPHHYIDSLRPGGPAAQSNALRSGDELLQVNEFILYGESHVTVRQALSKAALSAQRVRLTVARKAHTVNLFMPRPEKSLPIAYSILAASDDRMIKAKSDTCIPSACDNTALLLEMVSRRLRSQSLQLFTGLAIWKCVPMIVYLEKDSKGLGFSIVDYQDPLHRGESVIVVQSLVPGGVAQADGRIIPGDRLMFVNDEDLSNSTLDHAVAVLKSAPQGVVRLGIAKPIPVEQCGTCNHSPIISRSERLLAKGSSPRSRRRTNQLISYTSSQEELWIDGDEYRRQHPQSYYPSGSASPSAFTYSSLNCSHLSMASWSPCSTRSISPCGTPLQLKGSWASDIVYLPHSLERTIKIAKGPLSLGLVLDADADKGINGCKVKNICNKKAVGRDGRVQVGDYIVKINAESLRNVTNSQARAILKRTNLIGTNCNIVYITSTDAKIWRERYHQDSEMQMPVINRLSPKIFPKYYRSPFVARREHSSVEHTESFDSDIVSSDAMDSRNEVPQPIFQVRPQLRHAGSIVDGSEIEKFSYDIVLAAFHEAFMELSIAERCPDWTGSLQSIQVRKTDQHDQLPSASSSTEPVESPNEPRTAVDYNLRIDDKDRIKSDFAINENQSFDKDLLPKLQANREELPTSATDDSNSALNRHEGQLEDKQSTNIDTMKTEGSSAETRIQTRSRSKFWDEARTVILHKEPEQSFGISIVGGRIEINDKLGGHLSDSTTVSGIFIKSVLPDSPAGKSGMINMGDRIISVNGFDLRDATHEQAVQIIKNAKNPVKFVLQSLHSFCPQHGSLIDKKPKPRNASVQESSETSKEVAVQEAEKNNIVNEGKMTLKLADNDNAVAQLTDIGDKSLVVASKELDVVASASIADDKFSSPSVSNGKEESEVAIEKKLSAIRKRSTETWQVDRQRIDPDSAASLQRLNDDPEDEDRFFYTKDKIKRKYGDMDGNAILLKLEKVPRGGLGLSLAASRERDRPTVVVVAVRSTCPLPVEVGDELLEVNGQVLLGLSHLNASTRIRECSESGYLSLILLRRFRALDDLVTKSELKLSRSQTDPVFAVHAVVIPGDHSQNIETIADKESLLVSSPINEQPEKDLCAMTRSKDQQQTDESNTIQRRDDGRKKSHMEQTACIETGKETLIEIDKDGKGLGLSIVGGSDTVLGTVVIHEVYSDGAAAMDGRLRAGDQVLEVNNVSLRGVSHEQAISLLRRTPSKVRLLVYRDVNLQLSLLDPTQIYNIFEIELTKKPGRGLGISIVGRKNEPGVYVSEVVKGGAAEADARLMQGDQILAVNGQDVTNSMQEDVAAMLKACTGRVSLKVGRWKLTEAANRVHSASKTASSETSRNGALAIKAAAKSTLEAQTDKNIAPPCSPSSKLVIPQVAIDDGSQVTSALQSDLSPVTEELNSSTDQKSLIAEEESSSTTSQSKEIELITDLREDDCDSLLIQLKKIPDQQLGMGIGKRTRGILVTSLQPGSIAAEKLKVGDRLMAVNGLPVGDQLSAVTYVKASGEKLWLQISRPRSLSNA